MEEEELGMEGGGGKSAPREEPASAKALRLLFPDRKPELLEWQVAGLQREAGPGGWGLQGSYFNRTGKPQRVRNRLMSYLLPGCSGFRESPRSGPWELKERLLQKKG